MKGSFIRAMVALAMVGVLVFSFSTVHASGKPTPYTATYVSTSTTDSSVTRGNITIAKGTFQSVSPIIGSGPLVGCDVTGTFTDIFNSKTRMSTEQGRLIRDCGGRGTATYRWQGTFDFNVVPVTSSGTSVLISGTGEFDGAHDIIHFTSASGVTTLNGNFH